LEDIEATQKIVLESGKKWEAHYGNSHHPSILHVVHDNERIPAASLWHDLYVCQRLGLSRSESMVSRYQRYLQRGDLLLHRSLQDAFSDVQSRPIHCPGHPGVKGIIQQVELIF